MFTNVRNIFEILTLCVFHIDYEVFLPRNRVSACDGTVNSVNFASELSVEGLDVDSDCKAGCKIHYEAVL